jgi:hypothetical protein
MRKVISVIAVMLVVLCCINGCSTEREENRTAMLRLPNGEVVQGELQYLYHGSSGIVRVTIDGIEYKTHMSNVVILDGEE